MSNIPKFDNREFDDLMNEVKHLSKSYTPEWNFDETSSDFGVVFAKVFCHMMESTISMYNKTVYNYYLTFLNMLGTKLRSAAPASGMVVVKVTPGTEGAYIDKGTALFAEADTEDGTVNYETVDALSAIDTSIKGVYFTEPKSDFIGCAYKEKEDSSNQGIGPFRIFDSLYHENLQSHEVYFYDDVVFDMSNTDLIFLFNNNLSAKFQKLLPEIFSDSNNVTWQYYDGKKWVSIESVEKVENGVRIKFKDKTKTTSVMDETFRFIRCIFNRIPEGGIPLTSVGYKSISSPLSPNFLFADDTELSKSDFFPFGEQYTMYNTFSLICDEAFTKKGAMVEVSADIQFVKIKIDAKNPTIKYRSVMTEMDFADLEPQDIQIEKVLWEYWNGSGWAKLNTEPSGEEFFKINEKNETHRKIRFKCPEDIESMSVGSADGYMIRARISKMRDQFDFYSNYITPYINNVEINYKYEGNGHVVNKIFVRSDMKEHKFDMNNSGMINIMEKTMCDYPAMYLSFTRPLIQGMIRMFVDIEEGIHRFNPSLKWEYLSDDNKGGCEWKHIDVMDGTDDFSHSENITLIGKNDFKEIELFGEKGYFLRIVNPDGKYANTENIAGRPVINDIKINAVKVIQKTTNEPQYFSIEQDEEDKLCKLAYQNVSDVGVWIDEFEKVSTKEQERLLSLSQDLVEPEYNEIGELENLWVKWTPVSNLVTCGMNDRVYEVDYPKGEILFGNGKNGKIPPTQYNESIKIKYSVCSGSKGNVDAHKVNDFVDSIVNVDSVDNPSPIMGGVDMETIDNAARRMFGRISGGNRLVSLNDFEESICFNDRNIYKVRCLSHVDEDDNPAIGITSIAVLPREFMQGYEKFQGIKKRIWEFIDQKAPAALSHSSRLRVFEVGYVETSVSVDVVIDNFNSYQKVYKNMESRLEKFLNPVYGNFSGQGWNIGDFPRKELIYNYIKTVPNVKWIKGINIFTKFITPEGKKEIDFEEVKKLHFVVPVYGTPEINISVDQKVGELK